MPQSLSSILVHLVFSTKNREPWIHPPVETELHKYATTVVKNMGCPVLALNGTPDHIHVLFDLGRIQSVASVVEEVKTSTSRWIKPKGREYHTFHWQSGYGAFSVSKSNAQAVIRYIQRQKEHHSRQSFQDEFRALLRKHEVEFDERYVWD